MFDSAPTLKDRFTGGLLGHAVGDGLGAPFEGLTSDLIYAEFGKASDILRKPPVEKLFCTDDTHLSIAIARVLCREGRIDEVQLIHEFARIYNPKRGYGAGMRKLFEAVQFGEDWNRLAENIFPGGSFGNGGAMRVAPVGLAFHKDLNRVWEEAGRSAAVTHRHPLGVEGAQLFAMAVALVLRGESDNRGEFFGQLFDWAKQEEYQWLLSTAYKLRPEDSFAMLGSGLEAHRSVVTAITCFAASMDSYEGAVARALTLGNDTDTIMAMTGALSGARLGIGAIPEHLLNLLENEALGHDEIRALATELFHRFA